MPGDNRKRIEDRIMITRLQAIGCLRTAVDLAGDGGFAPFTDEEYKGNVNNDGETLYVYFDKKENKMTYKFI